MCRARHRFGTWIETGLGTPGPLVSDAGLLAGATLVCADVIEHVPAAEVLVEKLVAALEAPDVPLVRRVARRLAG